MTEVKLNAFLARWMWPDASVEVETNEMFVTDPYEKNHIGMKPLFTRSLDACNVLMDKLEETILVESISFGKEKGKGYCFISWWKGDNTDSYGCGVYAGWNDNRAYAFCLALAKVKEVKNG